MFYINKFTLKILLTGLLLSSCPAFANAQEDAICQNETSTIEINECLEKEFQAKEKIRLELETENIKQAKETEKEFQDMGSVQYSDFGVQSDKAKSTFETYREDECTRIMLSYGAGTGANTGYISCQLTLTEQRIEQLKYE